MKDLKAQAMKEYQSIGASQDPERPTCCATAGASTSRDAARRPTAGASTSSDAAGRASDASRRARPTRASSRSLARPGCSNDTDDVNAGFWAPASSPNQQLQE